MDSYSSYPIRKRIERSKSDMFLESLRHVSKEYCKESSISGLKHLVEGRSYIKRAIWIVAMIGALICSVSLVWLTFQKYFQAPLVTTQIPEGIPVTKIIFPAVGICTNNRISKRAVTELATLLLKEERNANYTLKEMLSLLFGLGLLYNLQRLNTGVNLLELHEALGNYDVNDLLKSLTPKCEDILLRCSWNEKHMSCSELFDFRLTMNGYCCTFNYLRSSDATFEEKKYEHGTNKYNYGNKSSFDFDQGLKVLLRLDERDDFYYNVPLKGALLQFSDAYDFPDEPSGSYSMEIICPQFYMTVLVSASFTEASRDIQHVGLKFRNCLFYDESPYLSFYTYSDCLLKCRMLFITEKCNCTPFNMPKLRNTKTCDIMDLPCVSMYYAQATTVRPEVDEIPPELELDLASGGISCPMCYPTCSKTAYSYDFTNVPIYPNNDSPHKDRTDWLYGANFTGTSIVHVKYAREVADCYGQNVIMQWFDLISNIGSTCGFVTGFSFVSVLEFIYFFTIKLTRDYLKRRNRVGRIMDEKPHYDHIRRYQPLYWNEIAGSTVWKLDKHE